MCQEADLLPGFMLLTGKDVDYAPGVGPNDEHHEGSTGEGSYALVYEGRMADPKSQWFRPVAIKRLKFMGSRDSGEFRERVKVGKCSTSLPIPLQIVLTMFLANIFGSCADVDVKSP